MRTVLVAHAQSTKNRMLREIGRKHALLTALSLFIFSVAGILPLCFGLGLLGYALMELIDDPTSVTVLASLFTIFPLFGGLTSGLVSGARELAWERYRMYPIRLRALFLSELVAAMGDLIPILVALASASVLVGMAIVDARILLVAPLVWAEAVLTVLITQMLIGGITESLIRVLRRVAGVAFVLVFVGAIFLTRYLSQIANTASAPVTERMQNAITMLSRAIDWLPTGASIRSLIAATHGEFARALVLHAYPLLALLACATLAAYVMSREANASHVVLDRSACVRLWSFRTPWVGIARAHFDILIRSPIGRFGLILPVVSIAIVKGPLAASLGSSHVQILSTFAYVAVGVVQFHFGLFGLDGHGIKTLLLLPIRVRDLFVGKTAALLVYHSAQLLILAVFLYLLGSGSVLELVNGILLALSIFFTQAAVGHRVSVWMPRAFPKRGMRRTAMPLPLTLLSLGTFMLALALYGGAYFLAGGFGHGWVFVLMCVALLVSLGAYTLTHWGLPDFFEKHREKLLRALAE